MTIIKKDPFADIFSIYKRLNQIFDERLARSGKEIKESEDVSSWTPPVDIYEDDLSFIITAELPGMLKDEIKLKIKDDTLIVQGARKLENPVEHGFNYHRIETNFGSFSRLFTLPELVDKENVIASYKDGILEIRLPKVSPAKTVKIEIK